MNRIRCSDYNRVEDANIVEYNEQWLDSKLHKLSFGKDDYQIDGNSLFKVKLLYLPSSFLLVYFSMYVKQKE